MLKYFLVFLLVFVIVVGCAAANITPSLHMEDNGVFVFAEGEGRTYEEAFRKAFRSAVLLLKEEGYNPIAELPKKAGNSRVIVIEPLTTPGDGVKLETWEGCYIDVSGCTVQILVYGK